MSSIMRVRSALTGRCEEWEVIGGLLSRAEGCWTFDARERMPRSSRLTVHAFTIAAENASTATQPPPARAGSVDATSRKSCLLASSRCPYLDIDLRTEAALHSEE